MEKGIRLASIDRRSTKKLNFNLLISTQLNSSSARDHPPRARRGQAAAEPRGDDQPPVAAAGERKTLRKKQKENIFISFSLALTPLPLSRSRPSSSPPLKRQQQQPWQRTSPQRSASAFCKKKKRTA